MSPGQPPRAPTGNGPHPANGTSEPLSLRDIVEHSTNLFYAHTPDGTLTYLSPQSAAFLDCTPEEARVHWQSFAPDNPANRKGYESTQRALETGIAQPPYRLQLRTRKNRLVWVEVHESPVIRLGTVVGMVGSLTDITHRIEAEEALRASEALHRRLFEESVAAMFLTDPDGRFLEVNPAGCELVGYAAQELRGRSFVDLFDPDDLAIKPLQLDLLKQQGHFTAERRVRRKDGGLVILELRSSILPDGRISAVARDITAARRGQQDRRLLQSSALAVAEAADVESAASIVLQKVCENADWPAGEAWLPNHSGRELHSSSTWFSRIQGFEAFRNLSRNLRFRPNQDLPGRAWSSRSSVWCRDLASETHFSRRDAALTLGFKAALAVPILAGDHVALVLVFFMSESRDDDARFIQLVDTLASQLGTLFLRKRAETLLKESEERFRSLTEASPLGLHSYRLDDQNQLILVGANPAANSVLNLDHHHLIGLPIEQAFPGLEGTDIPNAYRQVCKSGKPMRSEHVDYRDSRIHGAYEIVAFRTGTSSMAVLFQDIRERLAAQSALRLQSAAIESAANGVLITDRSGVIVWCNEALCRMTGFSLEELIGNTPRLLNSGRQPPGFFEQLWETILAGRVWHHELVNRRKDGSLYTQEQTITPVRNGANEISHFVAIQHDITERKRLEEQLRQAAKMESLGTLAGGVAHDFNNLLTVIQGHASLALEADPSNPSELHDNLQQITAASERAANLTRQLLAFSRQESLKPRLLDLNDIIGRQTRMLRRIIGEDIQMQLHHATLLPPVHADPTMIEQVLLNLAANARDAMPQGGTLVISTEAVHLDASYPFPAAPPHARPGHHVRLVVRDNGQGIPHDILPRIFEPFYTTKPVGKGTGLGLATVHGIVHRHRGWIDVESDLNQGTTFTIFLPAAPNPTPAPTPLETTAILPRGHGTLLLVEDETPVRALARRILESCGYDVIEAPSGAHALAILEANTPAFDLLLTDLVMPGGVNGRDLALRLRANSPQLKVVFTSGYSPGLLDDFPSAEKLYFLQKPYTPAELARMVRDCLDNR